MFISPDGFMNYVVYLGKAARIDVTGGFLLVWIERSKMGMLCRFVSLLGPTLICLH